MNLRSFAILATAFTVSLLAVGLPYWQIPYAQASLPNSLFAFGLLLVVVLSAASQFLPVGLLSAIAVIGAAVPVAVMVRVVRETSVDPTSHNLWPFEIVIASGLGFPAAFAGAVLGWLLVRAVRKAG